MPPLPPKPKRAPPTAASSASPAQQSGSTPHEMTLGTLRIGYHGITFASPDDSGQLPPTLVSLDDLVFVRELGKGASGTVGLYKQKSTGDRFAVKKINVMNKKPQDTPTGAAEIRNVFATPSPNAVRLFNAFVRDGCLLLLMEYMDGGNLEELLDKQPVLPEAAASYVASQILAALANLHRKASVVDHQRERKTVHRDIKPANVMLSRDGEIKIADFGVAGSADSIGLASFVGTATYMSPERIKGQRYGTESDIWSLGIVVAQLLLGRYPFKSVSGGFMALLKEVTTTQRLILDGNFSPEAQDFVDQCLKQESTQRAPAAVLLEHPWITRFSPAKTGEESPGRQVFREVMSSAGISRQASIVSASGSQPATPATVPTAAPSTPLVPTTISKP